jgi:hypothetical protein
MRELEPIEIVLEADRTLPEERQPVLVFQYATGAEYGVIEDALTLTFG